MEAGNQGSAKPSMNPQSSSTNTDSVESERSKVPEYKASHLKGKRQLSIPMSEEIFLHGHFCEKALKDQSFYFEMELDVEEKIACIFWGDRDMQVNYNCFGDSIYFDTTYRSYNCQRPLALFAGYNHHFQISAFGAALLYDDTVETFEWLFKTFLKYMSGKQPKTIFTTDQCDNAIASSIKSVFPNTFHALCPFSITEAANKNLGWSYDKEDFLKELRYLMEKVETEAEFNSKWAKMVDKYVSGKSKTAAGEKWLELMHGLKEQWSFVWVGNHFTAGMHTGEFGMVCYTMLRRLLQYERSAEEFFDSYDTLIEGLIFYEKLRDIEQDDDREGAEVKKKKLIADNLDRIAAKRASRSSTAPPSK